MKHQFATWGESRGKRLPASAYEPGLPVHVTICSFRRRKFFVHRLLAESISRLLDQESSTLAYCLMPDHLHWLLADASQMTRVVIRFKVWAKREAARLGWKKPLWQRSYHDRIPWRNEDLAEVARYLAANPVRAGLVAAVEEYPYQRVFTERFPRW